MGGKVNNATRISPFLLMIILVAFILSLSALYVAVDSIIVQQTEDLNAYSFLAIGFFGLALSLYMLMQTRGAPTTETLDMPRVVTTLECPKCDFKNIRDFQRGDYIFKEAEPCQKCQEKMKITAIYREVKPKK
jgi:hypothetical protein